MPVMINGKYYSETETKAYIGELRQLLREVQPVLRRAFFAHHSDTSKADELYDRIRAEVGDTENV